MRSIKFLIVDDHEMFRRSLRSLVESRPGWLVCGEAEDGIEAIEQARNLRPDVVLMDMSMPRMDGAEATRSIRREFPDCRILFVTQNDARAVSKLAGEVGALGVVSKERLAWDLLPAITTIAEPIAAASQNGRKEQPSEPNQGWLHGGGELATLIRKYDWSRTALGPLETWPQSLRTAVNLMLNSQHPIWIGWGPEKTFLYNDAYISVLSLAKHPWALGQPAQEVWSEIWHICGPMAERVFTRGEPTFINDLRLFMNRGDRLEETYYSFSYSPIYDESGKVAGLFCPSAETTGKVLHARRLRTLSELSAKSLIERTIRAACTSCIEIIAQNPDDIPFALFYLLDAEGKMASLAGSSHVARGLDRVSPTEIRLNDKAAQLLWPFSDIVEGTKFRVVSLPDAALLPRGPSNRPLRESIVLRVTSAGTGRPIGVLVAGLNPTRTLDDEYRTFFSLVADQVGTAIQNARAFQQDKERADALAEIDRAKTAFFSNVSHEFRTPLTLTLSPLEDLLSNSAALEAGQRERVELAHRNSLRLLRLVNTLLDFSRIEAGRTQASYEPTDLAQLTNELAGVFRSVAERAGLQFVVKCPPVSEPVYVDREMWEKIVFNLLSNAFKFTFNGEIEISLREVPYGAELVVRDTGTGIPQQDLPHLFERFYRVREARGRTFEGSGIGLSLVQELAKLHGGTARVESTLDQGSIFVVSVPFGKDHLPPDRISAERPRETTAVRGDAYAQEALRWLSHELNSDEAAFTTLLPAAQESGKPQAVSEKSATILLADDNADMRHYVRRLLSDQYKVVAAEDGEAALNLAREQRPDLILSDVMMPRMDGFALLDAIRADEQLRNTPFILLSARAGEESRVEGLQSGADDYLVKPFSARELLARVKSLLNLARVRRETTELQRQLLLNSELLASIVVSSDDAIVSKSLDGIITSWNHSAERMFGYPAAEAVGRHITLIIPSERLEEEADILARLRRGERVEHFNTVRVRKDGSRLDVSLTISPVRDPNGKIVGASKVARDVTAQRRAEQSLRESEERFRAIVETTPECVKLVSRDGTVLHMNTSGLQMVGARRLEEVVGNSVYPLVAPHCRERFRAFNERVCDGKKGSLEFEIVGFQGKHRFMETHAAPFRTKDGNVVQLSVTRDVTERKRAEERERKITAESIAANAKFRAVFEQTTVFAGIMTNDGTIIEANRLCLDVCGYRAEEVLGRTFWETPWWRNFAESRDKIRAATPQVAEGRPYRETLHYSWADGSEHLVDFALYPIVDHDGKVIFLHPTGVDITELKRVEENYKNLAQRLELEVQARTAELEERNADILRQSEQLRELSWRLLRAQDEERRHIARELHDSAGQTLAVLGMNVGLLVQTVDRSLPQLAKDAERIQDTVQQLHQEIRTASYLLHPPLLDESGLHSALSWFAQGLMERSGLEIKLDISDEFGRLPRDMELMVFRLVQESLTNIHRHSESKTATIHITRQDGTLGVDIQDQGKGMTAEKLAEIQSRGSGVGIRGMKERVRQFNGTMTINSGRSGTHIAVTIPIPKTEFPEEDFRRTPLHAIV